VVLVSSLDSHKKANIRAAGTSQPKSTFYLVGSAQDPCRKMETGNTEAAPYKNVSFSLELEPSQPGKKTGTEYRALYEKADKQKTAREKLRSDALGRYSRSL